MDEEDLDDVRRMGKVWVRERGTVDIMRWEGELVDGLFDKLEQQVGWISPLCSFAIGEKRLASKDLEKYGLRGVTGEREGRAIWH